MRYGAAGGAFRDWPVERLKTVKREDALKHPNWRCADVWGVLSALLVGSYRTWCEGR